MMTDDLTEEIIGAAIEVHKLLGPGLLESIYEEAICHECDIRHIRYARQVPVDMTYKGVVIKGHVLDLLVNDQVVVELKSASRTPEIATTQILSYLRATKLQRGLIINFGLPRLVDGLQRFSL